MSNSKPFHFKEFTVFQDKTAMKVGTDGVLLGAWVEIKEEHHSILDIGAGTGLISLMLAQRSNIFTIDAVEIDEAAYEQCVENFEESPWADRLYCYHASFNDFTEEMVQEEEKYDLIVTNPPFYTNSHQTKELSRDQARSSSYLPFDELLKNVSLLLTQNGQLSLIIPFHQEKNIIDIANQYGLFLNKVCHVKGTENAKIKRSLLSFSFVKNETIYNTLIIEISRHKYTTEYINLTKDFYIKM